MHFARFILIYPKESPKNNGQTTMPRIIFHQTKSAKVMVKSQPANQKAPAKLPAVPLPLDITPLPPLPQDLPFELFTCASCHSQKCCQ